MKGKNSHSKRKAKTTTRRSPRGRQATVTLQEALQMPSRTDWDRRRRMTEEEIEANALADPDNPPWTEEMLARARWVVPPEKQAVSIRLDRDVLEFFKSEGPGYQSRINAILRTYMDARKAS